jgi:hypothetical protein
MDTMICSGCGKEIQTDSIRCSHCGQIQGFGVHKLGEGIKPREIPDIAQPDTPQTENTPPLPPKTLEESPISQEPAAPTGSKSSRLKTIMSVKPGEIDLERIRREGLLPEGELTEANEGRVIKPSEKTVNDKDNLPAGGVPEWLRNSAFNPEDEKVRRDENIATPELATSKGEIPDWVRKLQERIGGGENGRPIEREVEAESVPAPEADVLQDIKEVEKQIAPAVEIQEPDSKLIESVTSYLGGLKTPRKIAPDGNKHLSRNVWGVIGLAMVSLAAALLWSGSSVNALSQPVEASLSSMTTYIDSISPEAVVLVGMDYDLSLAGEIENVALPVMVHLMRKQVSLVFVPMRPTGPVLSNHLLDLGLNWLPDYPTEKAFVITFIPGGAAGLLQLVAAPRQALPLAANGTNPWSSPELASIRKISDFSMVLLLTDSSGSGRDWLEQVQPRLIDTPLYAVVSKQAEPIFKPYQESGQIQAMVSGIQDGASYERVYLLTTTNQQMLRAYRGVLLFVAVLIACIIILSVFPQNSRVNTTRSTRKNAPR